jgi:hypothetical protein
MNRDDYDQKGSFRMSGPYGEYFPHGHYPPDVVKFTQMLPDGGEYFIEYNEDSITVTVRR